MDFILLYYSERLRTFILDWFESRSFTIAERRKRSVRLRGRCWKRKNMLADSRKWSAGHAAHVTLTRSCAWWVRFAEIRVFIPDCHDRSIILAPDGGLVSTGCCANEEVVAIVTERSSAARELKHVDHFLFFAHFKFSCKKVDRKSNRLKRLKGSFKFNLQFIRLLIRSVHYDRHQLRETQFLSISSITPILSSSSSSVSFIRSVALVIVDHLLIIGRRISSRRITSRNRCDQAKVATRSLKNGSTAT